MVPNVNRFVAKATAKLRDVCYSDVVESPKRVFVECSGPILSQANFDAVQQKVVLSAQVPFLDPFKEFRCLTLENQHDAPENEFPSRLREAMTQPRDGLTRG